jgi:hypothetical protein
MLFAYERPLCAISGHSKIGFANSGSPNKVKTLSRHRAPLTLKRVHTPPSDRLKN